MEASISMENALIKQIGPGEAKCEAKIYSKF